MNQKVRWHVIFTKQQCERKVLNALTKRGYQCYCPYYTGSIPWKNQDKPLAKPLFNSYVFVLCTEEQFPDIKRTQGVINFLYRLDRPAVVSNEEMTAIEHAVNHYQEIQLQKTAFQETADTILPSSGTFTHSLSSLGFILVASQKKAATSELVLAESPRHRLQRLSYHFRLTWR